jgi:hypothetical protein
MRPAAIRLLALTLSTAMAVPVVTTSGVEASSRHVRKHHQHTNAGWNHSWRRSSAAQQVRPVAPSWSGGDSVCPGLARSFDCKIWPPPFEDDPDRKHSGSDAGG